MQLSKKKIIEKGHFLPVEKFVSILPISKSHTIFWPHGCGIHRARCSTKRHLGLKNGKI
jgi:hypothetical protein